MCLWTRPRRKCVLGDVALGSAERKGDWVAIRACRRRRNSSRAKEKIEKRASRAIAYLGPFWCFRHVPTSAHITRFVNRRSPNSTSFTGRRRRVSLSSFGIARRVTKRAFKRALFLVRAPSSCSTQHHTQAPEVVYHTQTNLQNQSERLKDNEQKRQRRRRRSSLSRASLKRSESTRRVASFATIWSSRGSMPSTHSVAEPHKRRTRRR